jgi:hypothetical protein
VGQPTHRWSPTGSASVSLAVIGCQRLSTTDLGEQWRTCTRICGRTSRGFEDRGAIVRYRPSTCVQARTQASPVRHRPRSSAAIHGLGCLLGCQRPRTGRRLLIPCSAFELKLAPKRPYWQRISIRCAAAIFPRWRSGFYATLISVERPVCTRRRDEHGAGGRDLAHHGRDRIDKCRDLSTGDVPATGVGRRRRGR